MAQAKLALLYAGLYEQVEQALDTLNQPGGVQMVVDVEPMEALAAMGLVPICQEEH